jgi:hypothetical protein
MGVQNDCNPEVPLWEGTGGTERRPHNCHPWHLRMGGAVIRPLTGRATPLDCRLFFPDSHETKGL